MDSWGPDSRGTTRLDPEVDTGGWSGTGRKKRNGEGGEGAGEKRLGAGPGRGYGRRGWGRSMWGPACGYELGE